MPLLEITYSLHCDFHPLSETNVEIAKFPLTSNPLKEIVFTQPTVADGLAFAALVESEDEVNTTHYLNKLQGENPDDSALWTVQDRRTALWWIFVNSRSDAVMTFSYECQFCKGIHHADIDMTSLADTVELLTVPAFVKTSVPVNGVPTNWTLKPLDGRGAEMLERLRELLPDPEDTKNHEQKLAELRIAEIALCTSLDDDPDDFKEAANRRFDIINTMAIETEFTPLVARIQLMQRDLRHGLDMVIDKGRAHFVLPPQQCKKAQEGVDAKTVLHVPFCNHEFIPSLKPKRVDHPD